MTEDDPQSLGEVDSNQSKDRAKYESICINEATWSKGIQDMGCTCNEITTEYKKKSYQKAQIMGVGPEGSKVYYYKLSSIVIDIIRAIAVEKKNGRGWKSLLSIRAN